MATFLIVLEKAGGALVAAAGGGIALFLHSRAGTSFAFWLASGGPPNGWGSLLFVRVVRLASDTLNARPQFGLLAAAVLLAWALLLGTEAYGYWHGRVWAEMLIVVETAALLPAEVWDVLRTHRPGGALTLAANLLVLLYVGDRYRRRAAAAGGAGRRAAGREAGRAARPSAPGHEHERLEG